LHHFTKIIIAAAAIGVLASCSSIKETGRTIGHTTRDVTKKIGHASRDTVKAIGKGTKEVIKDIKDDGTDDNKDDGQQ
jgi:gas vesicle protein